MKAKEIRNLEKGKLAEKAVELSKELMKLKMQVASGTPPESPGKIRSIRRTLARIKTIEKEGGNN